MMPRPGWSKLIDLPEADERKHTALENFLNEQKVPFSRHASKTLRYRRYFVLTVDLSCAQAVLPAINELGDVPPPPRAA